MTTGHPTAPHAQPEEKKDSAESAESLIFLEGDPGIEPGTFGSGDQRSIH